MHSAVLPTPNHAVAVLNVIPGNPQLAVNAVMIHNVSLTDALKVTSVVTAQGLSPLAWDPPITQAAPTPPAAPEAPKPEQPT